MSEVAEVDRPQHQIIAALQTALDCDSATLLAQSATF